MISPTKEDVLEHLKAGRFAEARFIALSHSLRPRLPFEAERAIRGGDYQLAICELENQPYAGTRDFQAHGDARWQGPQAS